MAREQARTGTFQVHGGMLTTGAVLAAIGGLLGLAGLAIGGAALADATRRWANARETPPTEVARQQLARARAATVAGAHAWRNGTVEAAGTNR